MKSVNSCKEIWRFVPKTKKLYEVSSNGNVRNFKTGKILRPSTWTSGYSCITLCVNGKHIRNSIHYFVLLAFVGPRPYRHDGAHLNGNKLDNRIENLAWVTRKENMSHKWRHGTQLFGSRHQNSKLTESQVKEMRMKYCHKKPGERPFYKEIAIKYGVDRKTCERIIKGQWWKHVGV